ncbi:helix-turn-helix domain-containing protein [Streptomyces sp. NBC_00576]|uniref:helix-turn-helix domain-containing protein n=1 Tax=Streptomyces sp. NBC_00576 TaxID=2903665 RepID=UPI002E8050AA|nr:helix-turn-helix domain-containing protein [Streptomyces sp. NBC_00576]WUB73567.1 helix-turn-helix domain-containing protein [Streptomyces sp. NBC_00576]
MLDGRLVGLYPRLPPGETTEDGEGEGKWEVGSGKGKGEGGRGKGEGEEERGVGGALVVVSPAAPLRDGFHRQIVVTALAFLDHGRRLDRTAATLFTHPNAIRYRLARLQQLTGESLTDDSPGMASGSLGSVHWWWALRTWLESGSDRKS